MATGAATSHASAVAAILLAAGSGSRFGADKLMHPLPDGTPIAVQSARHLKLACPDSPAIAVVRPDTDLLARALEAEGFIVVVCDKAASGMGHSLAAAVKPVAGASGFVVALADMPFVDPSTIVAVRQALERGAPLAAPALHGKRGHPVGLGSHHAAALMSLTGDEGARRLIAGQKGSMLLIDVQDPGIFQDIDTPADLQTYLR